MPDNIEYKLGLFPPSGGNNFPQISQINTDGHPADFLKLIFNPTDKALCAFYP